MTGDSKYEIDSNHEECMKEYFGGLYVPPLKTCLKKEKFDALLNLAERCTRESAPLTQGYHFSSELSMCCFIRAVIYNIFDNIFVPLPFVRCSKIVEENFHNISVLDKYIFPGILLIFYGAYEQNHSYLFRLPNQISEMREQEDKMTFILSLKSEWEIKEQQEQYNQKNLQKNKNLKPIEQFRVPLITINENTLLDMESIKKQWKGHRIVSPDIELVNDYCSFLDIELEYNSVFEDEMEKKLKSKYLDIELLDALTWYT